MTGLQRLTTEYSEDQDRILLAGEDATGQSVVLWLTQRLMNRLVAHLCQWLESQTAAGSSAASTATGQALAQSFAQQAAAAALAPQPPVQATNPATQALVHSVDVSAAQEALSLRFKGHANAQAQELAQVGMNAVALRQWLGIVYQQYLRATWPTHAWPQWMEEASRPEPARTQTPGVMWH